MTANSVWKKAQTVELQVSENISPEFNIGFDKRITKEVEKELCYDNYMTPGEAKKFGIIDKIDVVLS